MLIFNHFVLMGSLELRDILGNLEFGHYLCQLPSPQKQNGNFLFGLKLGQVHFVLPLVA